MNGGLVMLNRNLKESDYNTIISVIDEWWDGRHMADMLPRLFFKHFSDTSFVFEENNNVIAFIIGFVSQVNPNQAYVHFMGIHPEYRKKGLGKQLYLMFFDAVKRRGCDSVSLITSPVNKNSIAFHRYIGFQVQDGNCFIGEVAVNVDYDGPGEDRVILAKKI